MASSTANGHSNSPSELEHLARSAKSASFLLASAPLSSKSAALKAIYEQLKRDEAVIRSANEGDLEEAKKNVTSGSLSPSLYSRLSLSPSKYSSMLEGILDVDRLPDPTGQITLATKLDDGLELYRVTCPVGVVLVIFEARPEVVVQISALAIKSGNAVILKGGREAHNSNAALFGSLQTALASLPADLGIPKNCIQLVSSREQVAELLKLDRYIDLAIPRGGNELVRTVKSEARMPVLGHADGVCAVYVDQGADTEKAKEVVGDAKTNYPAACNAAETLLIHSSAAPTLLEPLALHLISLGVTLHCDEPSYTLLSSTSVPPAQLKQATPDSFTTEYLALEIAVKIVPSLESAIEHINEHGSHHTDCIVTESEERAEKFMREVDSAGVYWNASTRFADGFRYGFGAEIGVSTNKTHARGPVGLEGMVIYKYKLYGKGQGAGAYSSGDKKFLHEPIKEGEGRVVKRAGDEVDGAAKKAKK